MTGQKVGCGHWDVGCGEVSPPHGGGGQGRGEAPENGGLFSRNCVLCCILTL